MDTCGECWITKAFENPKTDLSNLGKRVRSTGELNKKKGLCESLDNNDDPICFSAYPAMIDDGSFEKGNLQ